MIDGEDDAPESNFAEFEAAAASGEAVAEPAKEPEKAKEPDADPDEDDGADDAGEVNDKDKPEDKGDKGEKRRSKPIHQRLGEVTEKWRTAEQRAEAAEARAAALEKGEKPPEAPASATPPAKPDPNAKNDDGSDKYEFGEADPEYLADLTDWKVEAKLAERDAKDADEKRLAGVREVTTKLDTDWAAKAEAAVEKYPDFNEVVLEAAAAGEWECGPIMAIAISASEQGADIAYHMATNPKEAAELNKLAQTDPMEAARRFGRLEARYEMQGGSKADTANRTTNAPEPPQHRARGGSGQFEVSGDTTDFSAFEKKANATASARR